MKLSHYIPGSFYIRNEFNSPRIGLGHQYGRRFIVSGTIQKLTVEMTSCARQYKQLFF